ncbi:hypothetical protein SCHPADRAFT_922011 [Schizopora paradoxa]|uniref:Cysteine-rich PDZ-binding protein n=1 Tax=Schizopora paradoxa TaxID=27342 RepID=A0A0H2RM99_9AGAM|nr:hypothetical protein SCHPADRAFT_922011 [Schizopora paradoxa]
MVCKKCESKTSKLAAPDPFASSSSAIKSGSRKVGDNKLLRKGGGGKANPYERRSCKKCKSQTSQNGAKYCHNCAFKSGLCSICGHKILDTSGYSMSTK